MHHYHWYSNLFLVPARTHARVYTATPRPGTIVLFSFSFIHRPSSPPPGPIFFSHRPSRASPARESILGGSVLRPRRYLYSARRTGQVAAVSPDPRCKTASSIRSRARTESPGAYLGTTRDRRGAFHSRVLLPGRGLSSLLCTSLILILSFLCPVEICFSPRNLFLLTDRPLPIRPRTGIRRRGPSSSEPGRPSSANDSNDQWDSSH